MKRRRHLYEFLSLSFALLLGCTHAWTSINRGSIRGTVTDPQGAAVPRAVISVTNADTGVQQTTQTNSAGFYLVPELVPGTYRVHLESGGFVPANINGVAVKADDVATVDMQLRLGRMAQHVEVTATNPLVETTTANFSVPVEQRYTEELPLLGRDIQSLAQLIPGVTLSLGPPGALVGVNGGQYGGFPDASHILGSELAVSGGQAGANIWYLDGNINAAQGVDNAVVNPPPDAVSDFQAVTNGFAAEYGRAAGGVFNVVLRSGTNNFHGDLYEYNRNSYFEARNPFSGTDPSGKLLPPNPVNWNQFGGTIGGPLTLPRLYQGKNRTFFFAAWDVSILHESTSSLFTVPTLLARQGNYSEFPSVQQFGIYDPMTTQYDSSLGYFTRQPFTNPNGTLATSIPANRLDPVASYFMNQYPQPNFLDPRQQDASIGGCLNTCNNYQSNYGSAQTTHSIVAKVDHQISERNKLFVEWLYNPSYYRLSKLPWTGATVPLVGFNGNYPFNVTNEIAALGNTYTFSPTLVNEFRFSYSRQRQEPLQVPTSIQDRTGTLQHIQGLNIPTDPPLQPLPQFYVGNLLPFGSPSNNLDQVTEAATVLDNLTKVLSRHTLKAGFMYRTDLTGTVFANQPVIIAGGGLTSSPVTGQGGSPSAQFLLGAVDQGSFVRYVASTFGSTHTWSFYAQDDYRVTPKFTLNFGLHYDIFGWPNDRHDNNSVFDFSLPNPSDPIRKGGIRYVATPAHPARRAYPADLGDFGPRLNFAYAPFADRKTVIRGGIDVIYTNGNTQANGQGVGASEDPGYNQYKVWEGDATGQGFVSTSQVPAWVISQGAPTLPGLINPKVGNQQFLGPSNQLLFVIKDAPDPSVYLWNLQVQRELPGNMVVNVGYVGNRGVHLVGDSNRNYNHVPTQTRLQYKSQLNQLVPMPADLVPYLGNSYFQSQLFLPLPQYGAGQIINEFSDDGASSYHGLQAKVEKRFSHGLNFLAAYTFQKTMISPNFGGYQSNVFTGGEGLASGRGRLAQVPGGFSLSGGAQNLDNRAEDRSVSVDDVTHVLNMSWTYELPFGPGRSFGNNAAGIRRLLVQGWKISGSFNAQSGIPLQIRGPRNGLTNRVNVLGDPAAGRVGKTRYQLEQQWFNPNAFQAVFGSDPAIINLVTNGTPTELDAINEYWRFGTAGFRLGNARAPGFWGSDMSLSKDFRIFESKLLQLRMEAYNVFNHQNFGLPSTNWCLPPNSDGSTDAVHQFGCQFGRINNVVSDPRALQFGLKIVF